MILIRRPIRMWIDDRSILKAVNTNRYITRFYIFYQALILCLSFISIAVTAMSLWEALDLALSDSMSSIYTGAIIILPITFFVFICFKYESNTQLFWAFIFRLVANYDSKTITADESIR